MVAFTRDTPGVDVVKAYPNELKGKTVLITGPSDGTIGGQTVLDLVSGSPKEIILAGRTLSKIQPVIDKIKAEHPSVVATFVHLDLTDLSSIKSAAKEVSSKIQSLDVLINNAGIMAIKDYTKTMDGVEIQFAANHIGHFLLTNLLVPKIIAAKGRIINVSSLGYMIGGVHFDDPGFSNGATYNPWVAYAQSKTANILFIRSLASKLESKGVASFAVSPGLVLDSKLMTDVSQEVFDEGNAIAHAALGDREMPAPAVTPKPLVASSSTTVYAAIAPELNNESGAFLVDAAVWKEPLMPHATSDSDAEKLWALSEKLVGQKFGY